MVIATQNKAYHYNIEMFKLPKFISERAQSCSCSIEIPDTYAYIYIYTPSTRQRLVYKNDIPLLRRRDIPLFRGRN